MAQIRYASLRYFRPLGRKLQGAVADRGRLRHAVAEKGGAIRIERRSSI
jgi:hypothetical protein